MQLSEEQNNATYQIKQYQPGCITVNDQKFYSTLLITPDFLGEFNCQNFLAQIQRQPDVIILGTGACVIMPPSLLHNPLGIEIMTTPAACRTYTILSSERRQVLAILQP